MKHGLIENRVEDLRGVEQPEGITPEEMRFAMNTLQGFGPQDAYRRSIDGRADSLTPDQLSKKANKLKNKPIVQKYLAALVGELERVAVANALDLQMFLSAAIFTPLNLIDETHPLCQKKTVTTRTDKDGATTERVVYESVSKMDAAKTLIRMKGLDAPIKVQIDHRVGVMVVPMASGVEEWERLAVNSQKALMQDAVNID